MALLAFAFGILRNLTKERNGKVLDVVAATEFGVVRLFDVHDAEGYGKADEEGQAEYHRAPGRGGDVRRAGAVDDFGVVCGERLRELVLLTSLQQEKIQLLLDFLLALHAEQVFGLCGVGGDT